MTFPGKHKIVVLLAYFVTGLDAECPNINDMPVLNDAGDHFYCAFRWQDNYPWDHDIPLEACLDEDTYLIEDDAKDYDTGSSNHWSIFGGTIVKAGCTLYGYENSGYSGNRIDYNGPAIFPDGCSGGNCPFHSNDINWGFSIL